MEDNLYFENERNRCGEFMNGEWICSSIMSFIGDVKRTYKYDVEELENLNKTQTDLLHLIEFQDLNGVEGYKIYKKLHELRIRRRLIKDEMRSIEPLYKLLINQNSFVELLKATQATCGKESEAINSQKYALRRPDYFTEESDNMDIINEKYGNKIRNIRHLNNTKLQKIKFATKLEKLNS